MISREADYAYRIIRVLSSKGRMSLQQICELEHIPPSYAYKILKKLQKAQLVSIFRGAKGGYELSCDLGEKTFYDVYHAIEGELLLNACQEAGSFCPNNHGDRRCNVHNTLCSMQNEFIKIMKKRTLRSVI
ncbi:MAG: putative HTH-type transcriptional regulator [Bacillota bacterium]|jgi:Rrf2 family protein|nr:putative HTH-type transcriptional regulator [Bacillota bacterium]